MMLESKVAAITFIPKDFDFAKIKSFRTRHPIPLLRATPAGSMPRYIIYVADEDRIEAEDIVFYNNKMESVYLSYFTRTCSRAWCAAVRGVVTRHCDEFIGSGDAASHPAPG